MRSPGSFLQFCAATAVLALVAISGWTLTSDLPPISVPDELSFAAITMPCKDRTLGFTQPGKIAKVNVEEGQRIKIGDILVEQDSTVEAKKLQELRMEAESEIRLRAAEAQLKQKQVDYDRLLIAKTGGAATDQEVERAKLEVEMADWSLELTKHTQRIARVQMEQLELQIARMKLVSPLNGRVERIALREGEPTDVNARMLRVVQIDPLWLDVAVPLSVGREFKVGQRASVTFPGQATSQDGKIIHVAAVAEAGSDTLRVRVELPNPAERPAGERVTVRFPEYHPGDVKGVPTTSSAPAAVSPAMIQ